MQATESKCVVDGLAGNQSPRQLAVTEPPADKSRSHPPALLNERQGAALLGVSTRKFHALRSEAWFPLAVELGPRALRWYRVELLQAVADHAPRRSLQAEPKHLAQVRTQRAGAV